MIQSNRRSGIRRAMKTRDENSPCTCKGGETCSRSSPHWPVATGRRCKGCFRMKLIPLSRKTGCGKFTSVSDEDYEYLMQWNWTISTSGYVVRANAVGVRPRNVHLHREVAQRAGMDMSASIDHRFGDKLDNCRHALRPATQSQNCANRKVSCTNRLGVKGVGWLADRSKYRASINIGDKFVSLGQFDTIEEASRAYEEAARKHFGEFARTE